MNIIIKKGVQSIAGGVGLASESTHAHRERKKHEESHAGEAEGSGSAHDAHSPLDQAQGDKHDNHGCEIEDDEAQLELDEVQHELVHTESPEEKKPAEDAAQTIEAFLHRHPLPARPSADTSFAQTKLILPIILPQRRPKDKSRCFIRAYAPALEPCSIDQAMFLDFLSTFEKSSEASP